MGYAAKNNLNLNLYIRLSDDLLPDATLDSDPFSHLILTDMHPYNSTKFIHSLVSNLLYRQCLHFSYLVYKTYFTVHFCQQHIVVMLSCTWMYCGLKTISTPQLKWFSRRRKRGLGSILLVQRR